MIEGNSLQKKPSGKNHYVFEAKEFDQKVTFLCSFCGGSKCPQQDYLTNKKQPNAIEGLHSNWITDDILAMQRPSQRLIAKFSLYDSWNKTGITTILNLQEPGEHPYCGDGIVGNHGFSYIPDQLYKHKIHFFNPSWEDMTATTCDFMMKIMNIFDHTFQTGGKIAVHCHAGRGRTLMAICAWLIYSGRCTAKESILLAVQKRQGVLTKNSQRQFLFEFQNFLRTKRRCFGILIKMPFQTIVQRHQETLLSRHKDQCKSVPFLHYVTTQEIITRLRGAQTSVADIVQAVVCNNWSGDDDHILKDIKKQFNEMSGDLKLNKSVKVLLETLFDFYDQLPFNPLDNSSCQQMQRQQKEGKQLIQMVGNPAVIHSTGSYVLCTILSFIKFLTAIKEVNGSEDQINILINRIVKALVSKKRYNRGSYVGRCLRPDAHFNKHEVFVRCLIQNGVKQNYSRQQFSALQIKIRRKNADLFFHKNSLKESREKEFFQEHQMKKEVYLKIK